MTKKLTLKQLRSLIHETIKGHTMQPSVFVVQIPGNIAVSHDFFDEDKEDLEDTFNVGIDSGPGGVVEISGEENNVMTFLQNHNIKDYDVVDEDDNVE